MGDGVGVPVPASAMLATWLDRCRSGRDRLLASPRFQRLAAAFPLTRPIARRRARALFDLCAGFVYSQVLLACVQLRLFELLLDGPLTAAALSQRLSMPQDGLERLLGAAVALRLLERRRGGRFGLGPLGAALADNPGVAAMIAHHPLLYADLQDPVALLRGEAGETRLARYWGYAGAASPAGLPAEAVAGYSRLMALSQPMVAHEVLQAYPLQGHRRLLDVGGGEGAFLTAVAARAPHLELVLFDLPAVAERARAAFTAAQLPATAVAGDFFRDSLPAGADLISLVRILHDHDDDAAAALLRRVADALPPDGTVLIAEPVAGAPGAEPMGDAYFGLYLLAMGRGRPRRFAETAALLRGAGFSAPRLLPTRTPLIGSVIVATLTSR